jgi:hypothetical protein
VGVDLTPLDFQARVEIVVGMLERMHDRQYPLRSIPMDLVAESVGKEAIEQSLDPSFDLARLSPHQIAVHLNAILARNAAPGHALYFQSAPSQFDLVSPWQASTYVVHDGVERLRDGG